MFFVQTLSNCVLSRPRGGVKSANTVFLAVSDAGGPLRKGGVLLVHLIAPALLTLTVRWSRRNASAWENCI